MNLPGFPARMKRFFLPLCTVPYGDFKHRGKSWEVRALARQYTPKNLVEGREIELRRGYSGESLWGIIGEHRTGSLEDIFAEIPLEEIEPQAASIEEAIAENKALLGEREEYIAFGVLGLYERVQWEIA